jgi:hypothetical protein
MDPLLPTHIPDVISQVLMILDYHNIASACRTNKDLNKMYQDEYFWKLKVERDYGMLTEYKPSNITYRQQYADFLATKEPYQEKAEKAATEDRLDILQWLTQYGVVLDRDIADIAAFKNSLNVLEWLAQTYKLYPDRITIKYLVNHCNISRRSFGSAEMVDSAQC